MKESKKLSISEPAQYAGGWCPVCNTSGPTLALNWFRCGKCKKLVCPNCIRRVGKKLVCVNCSPIKDKSQPVIGSPTKKEVVRIFVIILFIFFIGLILISFLPSIFPQMYGLQYLLLGILGVFLSFSLLIAYIYSRSKKQ
jgi:hypothetical protein